MQAGEDGAVAGRVVKLALILAATALACSSGEKDGDGGNGGGGPAEEPSSAEQIQSLCTSQCAHVARCSASDGGVGTDAPPCDSECNAELGTLAGRVRADAIAIITECFDSLSCDVSDDTCLGQALEAVGADINTPIVMQCLTKEDECQGTPGDYRDDICATMALLTDSEKAAASRCLERACSEILSCLAPYGA
jgi:hypothetical protein